MGHAACEVMLESKASCEDDQKKQVWSADPLNQSIRRGKACLCNKQRARQGSKQGVKKKKWAPSEALEDVLSLPALKKEVMRECSKLSTNLLDR